MQIMRLVIIECSQSRSNTGSNIGIMSNVSVTATEIQAISDFLTGSAGGSTGGGDTGGGTSGGGGTVDGQALFTANCAACHGLATQPTARPHSSCHK